jgi:chemotaxis-related protein WspB
VPLIDLTQLALGHPVRENLSTRIVLVRHPDGRGGERLLGLLAEHVTETMRPRAGRIPRCRRRTAGRALARAGHPHEGALVQWMQVRQLLTPELRELLFPAEAA